MGQMTVVIPDELEDRLRSVLPSKRGMLSKFVMEAIEEKLRRMEESDEGN